VAQDPGEGIEICSYRAVFDLERRIYRIDRLRLNPSGVPVRGIVYFLAILAAALSVSRLPLIGLPVKLVPWYLADLLLPGAMAAFLAVVKVEGRPFHLFALALLRYATRGHELAGMATSRGTVWELDELVMLVDGSDSRMRGLRYSGPGAVRVGVAHVRAIGDLGPFARFLGRGHVSLTELADEPALPECQVIALRPGVRLEVRR
jgi:hypothetical protein